MRFNVTIWSILCILAPAVALSVAATWAFIGADERSVSGAIATKLSQQAALDASEQQELSDLRTEVAEQDQAAADQKAIGDKEIAGAESRVAESVQQLKSQLKDEQAKNKQLSDALAVATKQTVSIRVPAGQARFIGDNSVAVGVESISDSFATIQLGDYPVVNMIPGESRAIQVGDKNYVVTLMRIESSACTFAIRKE